MPTMGIILPLQGWKELCCESGFSVAWLILLLAGTVIRKIPQVSKLPYQLQLGRGWTCSTANWNHSLPSSLAVFVLPVGRESRGMHPKGTGHVLVQPPRMAGGCWGSSTEKTAQTSVSAALKINTNFFYASVTQTQLEQFK